MDIRAFYLSQHARIHTAAITGSNVSYQDNMLRGTTHSDLRARPEGDFNSMIWLLWHLTRGEDIPVSIIIAERPQLFDEGKWGERMGITRRDLGTKMTSDEVDVLSKTIDIDAVLEYRAAVCRRTQEIVRSMADADFDAPITDAMLQEACDQGGFGPGADFVPERWAGRDKAFTLSHILIAHACMHFGQGDTIRHLLDLDTI